VVNTYEISARNVEACATGKYKDIRYGQLETDLLEVIVPVGGVITATRGYLYK
jgi:hypothetical protein